WLCPSNMAIVKYWGKKQIQIPMNPSLSITLKVALTSTRIEFNYDPSIRDPQLGFLFEGKEVPAFANRVRSFIRSLEPYIPVIAHTDLNIVSDNTFPHSSGIASSASAMGALALCLVQMESEIHGEADPESKLKKASFIARLGSGSASRSMYPGMALWGEAEGWLDSSDEYAIPVTGIHDAFGQLRDTILIVESGQKKVSSSAGHSQMETNPFAEVRFRQARENLTALHAVLTDGDWERFITLMEEEALSLHALMMTGNPGTLLLQPGTLSILQKVREFRADTGCHVGFTLDAGANVHLLYANRNAEQVDHFISSELVTYCEAGTLISDGMGNGPSQL
ncbi:MAG: hypothetical protein KAT15_30165, partial [Bacteroidales bacterium]|nr:hypothetical protein [Bacteroidales bacterium]